MMILSAFKQVQEFEAEFEKLPADRPIQTRFLRSQQDLKAKLEQAASAAPCGDGDASGKEACLVILRFCGVF